MRDYLTTYANIWAETKKPSSGFCFLIQVEVRKYDSPPGPVIRGTDHDETVTISGDDFSPVHSFRSDAFRLKADGSVDNTALFGITSTEVTEDALTRGYFDGAEVTMYLACWTNPSLGKIPLKRGNLGHVKAEGQAFTAEVRGLTDLIQKPIGRSYMPECDVFEFGDSRCGLDISSYIFTGTVSGAPMGDRVFTISVSQPNDYFQFGKVEFLDGDNIGRVCDIMGHTGGVVSLLQRPPFRITDGDSIRLTRGCPRSYSFCKSLNNLDNFRGFPSFKGQSGYFMPAEEILLQSPSRTA